MTRLCNDPRDFVPEALAGLIAAYGDYVRPVAGGVVRATIVPEGQVAVVIGGGSGHYPAFAGLVGEGLATGAVCGEVFTSPSAAQAYRVAHGCDHGGGVLLSYGNYAGDVLHFGLAEQRLRAEGHDVRTVLVTDDVASAPPSMRDQRRGIAGDFVVFKIAGAIAESGASLDEVERVARKANARTRSLGVALSGCTLPGADEPLFTVEAGMMSIGLGIHGEQGISDEKLTPARELARKLVNRLLAEIPPEVSASTLGRLAVIVNGLGTVKYEELFVLFKDVRALLSKEGIEIVEPEVRELVTSLDMGGVSLTIVWLDEELERWWTAPARTPAYTKTAATSPIDPEPANAGEWATPTMRLPGKATEAAALSVGIIVDAIDAALDVVQSSEDDLGRLDAVAGDGDHGTGMSRGLRAASSAAHEAQNSGAAGSEVLVAAGRAWSEFAGGTSGALWGAGLETAGITLHALPAVGPVELFDVSARALRTVTSLGGAQLGDKTLVDAFQPFVERLAAASDAGTTSTRAWAVAAAAATEAARRTQDLTPQLGRARPLASRSVGHADPGATSFALIVTAIGKLITERHIDGTS